MATDLLANQPAESKPERTMIGIVSEKQELADGYNGAPRYKITITSEGGHGLIFLSWHANFDDFQRIAVGERYEFTMSKLL